MDILFDLKGSENKPTSLFCEWGQGYCCVAGIDNSNDSVTALKYYTFENPASENTISELIDAIGAFNVSNKIVFSFAFPQQVFIPRKIAGNDIVKTVYGTSNSFSDQIHEWQVTSQYALPEQLYRAVKNKFHNAEYFHVHTAALKNHTGFEESEQLIVDFTPKDFRVLVKKSGKLQLAQVYYYTAPLDVVYYLLKIVGAFGLNAAELLVVISGLIEENSGLYKELHKYFHNLKFARPSSLQFEHPHPGHFFSTVFNLTSCVS